VFWPDFREFFKKIFAAHSLLLSSRFSQERKAENGSLRKNKKRYPRSQKWPQRYRFASGNGREYHGRRRAARP